MNTRQEERSKFFWLVQWRSPRIKMEMACMGMAIGTRADKDVIKDGNLATTTRFVGNTQMISQGEMLL